MDLLNRLLTAPLAPENRQMVFALVVLLVLVLMGVVSFGIGGHLVANRGVSGGYWATGRLGLPNGLRHLTEGMTKIGRGQNAYSESMVNRQPPRSVGVYDSPAQIGLGGYHSTISSYDGKKWFDRSPGGELYDL